jgi:hypothetical protein
LDVAWLKTVRCMRCAALPWRSTLVRDDDLVKACGFRIAAVITVKNKRASSLSDAFA